VPNIVSKQQFANLAGVTPAAITKAIRKQLAGAVRANRIDAAHPDAQAYLTAQNPSAHRKPRSDDAPPDQPKPAPHAPSIPTLSPERSLADPRDPTAHSATVAGQYPPATDAQLAEFEDDARALIEKWGTSTYCKDWLDATKQTEVIRGLRLKNAATEGRLVSREFIETHAFGWCDAISRKLLTDAPKTGALRAMAAAKSGAPVDQLESEIRKINSSHLAAVKAKIAKTLRDA
jgi:hypothetical protein